jgi:hypothetical protein
MASCRTAFALITLGALVWVYALTALIFRLASPILPVKGKSHALICLAAFWGGVYHLIIFFISPVLAGETSLFITLAPVYCITAGTLPRLKTLGLEEAILQALFGSLTLGLLILALALIREPLGFGSISLPGGMRGIITIVSKGENPLLPVQALGSSAGAFLLTGYGLAIYRRERKRQSRRASSAKKREKR